MRASVSDILTYAKCPYAWWIQHKLKLRGRATKPMDIGTKVHKEVEEFMETKVAHEHHEYLLKLTQEERDAIWEAYSGIKALIEVAISFKLGTHTINCRPDGYIPELNTIIQLKTVPAKKAHYSEYVRIGLHENIYSIGLMDAYKTKSVPMVRTILYVKTKVPKLVVLPLVTTTEETRLAATDFSIKCLDEMEQLSGVEDEEAAKAFKSPPSCIQWTTGIKCEFYGHCHERKRLTKLNFVEVKERYPEFA